MKAIVLERYGSPLDLRVQDVPCPEPAEDQVLIRIAATSINDWDWCLVRGAPFYIRLLCGLTKPKIRIPGVDIAGRVEAVGKQVSGFAVGDKVYGDLSESGFGAFAEYVCVPETAITHMPDGMSFTMAAALPHAALLAVQGLRDEGNLRAGQRVLINGAGGGVGTLGVQVAKHEGIEDITGVDHTSKLEMMRARGFGKVIDYTREDFTRNGETYDLILDTKTNRPIRAYKRALSSRGTYVTVGGNTPDLYRAIYFGPIASRFGKKKIRFLILKPNRGMDYVNQLFEAGKIEPEIDGPYPMSEIPRLIEIFGEGKHKGKIVIDMTEPRSRE